MKRRIAAGVASLALALLTIIVTPTDSAQAASTCTGWQSTLTAPSTIRVYRTALHRTVTVDFRRYVRTVMASEWGHSHPRAALRAGAVAIKQFGWYYAMHWRGGRDRAGHCFDVVDTARDQVYDPSRRIFAVDASVVNETWGWTLRKGSRFFLTGYRSGNGTCGRQQDGWHLMQLNAARCATRLGESTETILRRYYGADVSIVTPGADDVTGDGRGDVTAVTTDPTTGDVAAAVLSTDSRVPSVATDPGAAAPGGSPLPATPAAATPAAATPALATLGDSTVLGRAGVDVTGDRLDDLVQLLASPDGTTRIDVMSSTGTGFAAPVTRWSSANQGPILAGTTLSLVAGDFDGDGVGDVGLVAITPASAPDAAVTVAASTELVLLESRRTGFRVARTWWSTPYDLTGTRILAGDVTGDGRSDLIVLQPTADGLATNELVAPSTNRGGLGPLSLYGTIATPLADLTAVVGDVDRTGRDDVILARRIGSDQLSLVILRATSKQTFSALTWWVSTTPFSWTGSKLAVADLDSDGRGDVVVYADAGPGAGTVAYRFMSTGSNFKSSLWRALPGLDWTSLQAY